VSIPGKDKNPESRGMSRSDGPLTRAIAAIPWGAEDPVEPPVRVEFRGDRHYNGVIRITPIDAKDRKKAATSMAAILPAGAAEALLEQESKVLAWLGKSPANAAQMAADPITALRKAGVKLEKGAYERLTRHREAARRMLNPDVGKDLGALKVEVGPAARIPKMQRPKSKKRK
jgi:hypothetical protein